MKPETLWLLTGLAGTLAVLVCLWCMMNKKNGLYTRLCALQEGFSMPDLRFRYSAEGLYSTLDAVGDEGRRLMMRFWCVDLALIAGMFAMMATVTNNIATIPWIAAVMLWANIVRAAADLLEDVLLLIACAGYPAKKRAVPANVAGIVTAVKWVAAVCWVAGMFLSLFLRGWSM
ncbi:MAG: hypothetical protein IJ041_07595 [Clostridia bacterium]|nr:hypothetical protein [Clostridia bacterium]